MTVIIGEEDVYIEIHGREAATGIDIPIGIGMGITTVTVVSIDQTTTGTECIPGGTTKAGEDERRLQRMEAEESA
jgi:hypothetical protein